NWISRLKEFDAFLKDSFPGCVLKDTHPGYV
ncbi:unnamed protein product, partial [Allacma fusca]